MKSLLIGAFFIFKIIPIFILMAGFNFSELDYGVSFVAILLTYELNLARGLKWNYIGLDGKRLLSDSIYHLIGPLCFSVCLFWTLIF